MAAYRFAETAIQEKEHPPACSEECIWYEPKHGCLTCANRYENICSLHRKEIFDRLELGKRS